MILTDCNKGDIIWIRDIFHPGNYIRGQVGEMVDQTETMIPQVVVKDLDPSGICYHYFVNTECWKDDPTKPQSTPSTQTTQTSVQSKEPLKITPQEFNNWVKQFDGTLVDFKQGNWINAKRRPLEDGFYVTIRCGLGGIYTKLDRYVNGHFMLRIRDGSEVIAYSKDKVELPNVNV